MPGASLLGVHVKASLVKFAHEKAYHKVQTLLTPPSGQVWKSYYFAGSVRIAVRVGGGAVTLAQALFRPAPRLDPWSTPVPGLFLCSASTPPGGGVHGMCGWHAARAALRSRARYHPIP